MLTYQLEGCVSGEGTAGSLSPPKRRRAVSLRPIAGTCLVAAANPKTGISLFCHFPVILNKRIKKENPER